MVIAISTWSAVCRGTRFANVLCVFVEKSYSPELREVLTIQIEHVYRITVYYYYYYYYYYLLIFMFHMTDGKSVL